MHCKGRRLWSQRQGQGSMSSQVRSRASKRTCSHLSSQRSHSKILFAHGQALGAAALLQALLPGAADAKDIVQQTQETLGGGTEILEKGGGGGLTPLGIAAVFSPVILYGIFSVIRTTINPRLKVRCWEAPPPPPPPPLPLPCFQHLYPSSILHVIGAHPNRRTQSLLSDALVCSAPPYKLQNKAC